jgi:hypothetical protein
MAQRYIWASHDISQESPPPEAEVLPWHGSDTITVRMLYTSYDHRETRPMDPQHSIYDEIIRLQAELLAGLASLELVKPPVPQKPGARSLELATADDTTVSSPHYHKGHFGPEHGLSPQEAWLAEQILRQKKPFRGPHSQQKEAARIAGIISSVKGKRVQNSRWGRKMLARRGGLAMAAHGLHILREIAPRGAEASKVARKLRKATAHWDRTGQVLELEQHEIGEIPLTQPSTAWQDKPFLMW